MENKLNTPWSAVGDKTPFGYIVNCNGNRLDLERTELLTKIAQCVNACAGMDDPVMEVQRLKKIREGLEKAGAIIDTAARNKNADSSHQKYHAPFKNAAGFGIDKETVKAVESIYTGSTETLQNAVDEARENLRKNDIECAFDFSNVKTYGGLHDIKSRPRAVTPPSWHDLGVLPPVGTVCEIAESTEYLTIRYPEGEKVKIYSHFTDDRGVNLAAFVNDIGTVGGVGIAKCFRPIQTEKQKTIKAILKCFDNFFSEDGSTDNAGDVCEKIYDQFIAKK